MLVGDDYIYTSAHLYFHILLYFVESEDFAARQVEDTATGLGSRADEAYQAVEGADNERLFHIYSADARVVDKNNVRHW